jgi:spore coat polysaccharide biosynthesis protein SpsF
MYQAATEHGADSVVRITADNPLLSPSAIDTAVRKLNETNADYVSNKIDRTFPSGLDVETFTFDSFTRIERQSEDPYYREHVTPYYREFDEFDTRNLAADEVFDETFMRDRTELRLTLDTPDDYELFRRIYENVEYERIVDIRDAIAYVEENNLQNFNTD